MALGKKAIETISVNAVRDSIVMTDLLDQYIPDNDKEPFWDGSVYIYNEKDHSKESFRGRIPVQVKGTEKSDFSKEEITFPVTVVDLKGYLSDGGTIYFVVCIGNRGLTKKIYYVELTPIKIRVILNEAKNQKKKSITLKEFPFDNDLKTTIFMNCWQHCQKQASFAFADLYSLEELQQQGILEKITIPFSGVGVEKDLQKALLKNDVYLYANIKGSSIPQPLPFIPKDLQTTQEINTKISIDGNVYYESIRVIKTASYTQFVLGESFTITSFDEKNGMQINYKSSDSINVLSKDLDFILTLLDVGYFESDGHRITIPLENADYSNFIIDDQRVLLSFAKKAVKTLTILHCTKSLSLHSVKDEDYRNLERLYSALVDNSPANGLKEDLPPVCKIKVGNLCFIIILTPQKDKKSTYQIKDFFNSEVLLTYQGRNDKRFPISQFALLKADDLLVADNVNWKALLPSFQKVDRHEETIERANWFLLELLIAYDKTNNKDILDVANDFSNWIMEASNDELPYSIRKLNELQIIKRKRKLTDDETKSLYEIILQKGIDDAIYVGAYLLLGQQESAKKHFEKLTPEMQEGFKTYPIYHFWKQSEDNENE